MSEELELIEAQETFDLEDLMDARERLIRFTKGELTLVVTLNTSNIGVEDPEVGFVYDFVLSREVIKETFVLKISDPALTESVFMHIVEDCMSTIRNNVRWDHGDGIATDDDRFSFAVIYASIHHVRP